MRVHAAPSHRFSGGRMDLPLWYWHLSFGLLVIVAILLYESD
jgi:hypothetical protein